MITDARIIIDELVVDCAAPCSDPAARQLAGAVARAFASQLQSLQLERCHESRRADAVPRPLHLERVVVRLASPRISPSAIATALRDALDGARRRAHG